MTKWRYQPVFQEQHGERCYTLIEAFFDADDRLTAWTEDPAMVPQGETPDELTADLARMLVAVRRWEAVSFGSLHVGMSFKRILFDANELMRMLDEVSGPRANRGGGE